jgi:transposase
MAYDDDLRQKVLHAIDTQQGSQARLAEIFGVSLSWLKGVVRRRRETGNTHVLPHRGGKRPKLTSQQREHLWNYVTAHDDLLLRQVQEWLEASHQIRLSVATLSRLLRRLDLPRKKRHFMPPSATPQPSNRDGMLGVGISSHSIPHAWSLSTKAE